VAPRPAARSEGPEAAILATVRPLGPGRSWAGLGVVRGSNLAPGPLGSVAGGPDRHRGWLLCPSSIPAAGGPRLRPCVLGSRRPAPQLQVQVHAPVWGVTPHPLAKRRQTGTGFLHMPIFTATV
jgi:hypothetical protein